jgi:tetratricopeptide (TPR) repeat protein
MLAGLLRERGQLDEAVAALRHAGARDPDAARELSGLLSMQGHVDEAVAVLRRHADPADKYGTDWDLAKLLREQGHIEELRQRAQRSAHAAQELAAWLHKQGHLDEAIAVLRRHADTGHWDAARQLARLLHEQD